MAFDANARVLADGRAGDFYIAVHGDPGSTVTSDHRFGNRRRTDDGDSSFRELGTYHLESEVTTDAAFTTIDAAGQSAAADVNCPTVRSRYTIGELQLRKAHADTFACGNPAEERGFARNTGCA